jgi:hypothetical protein
MKGRVQQAADIFSAFVQKADELAVIDCVAEFMLRRKLAAQIKVHIRVGSFAERKEQAGIALKKQGERFF